MLVFLKCAQNTVQKRPAAQSSVEISSTLAIPRRRAWPSAAAQHREGAALHVAGLEKGQDSEFVVWFLLDACHFHITVRFNHCKLGAVCIV